MLHVQVTKKAEKPCQKPNHERKALLPPKHGQNASSSLVANQPSDVMQRLYPEDRHKELWLSITLFEK